MCTSGFFFPIDFAIDVTAMRQIKAKVFLSQLQYQHKYDAGFCRKLAFAVANKYS